MRAVTALRMINAHQLATFFLSLLKLNHLFLADPKNKFRLLAANHSSHDADRT